MIEFDYCNIGLGGEVLGGTKEIIEPDFCRAIELKLAQAIALVEHQRVELKRLRSALEQVRKATIGTGCDSSVMALAIDEIHTLATTALAPQSNESAGQVSEGV